MPSKKGACYGTSAGKYNLYIVYNLATPPEGGDSQDITNNRSYINVKTTLQRNDGTNIGAYNNDAVNRVVLNVAGTERVNKLRGIDTRNQALVILAEWSDWVYHNSEGELIISVSGSFTMSGLSTLTSGSVSDSWTLTTIPRKSDLLFSSPATMGSSMNFTISRKAAFTHTIRYAFGSASGTIADKTSTYPTVSWTPPLSLANQVPNATSGAGTIYLDTYNGSTLIGTNSYSITLNVPSSVVPSPGSINFTRINGSNIPAGWNLYVQGQSKVTVSSSGALGAYGSSISSYTISGGGYSGSSSSITTGFLNTAGTNTFTITVRDSRGRINSVSASITVTPWSVPTISSLLVERCDSNGTYDDEGLYFKMNCAYTFASVAGFNVAAAKVAYEINGSGDPIQYDIVVENGVEMVLGPINTDYTYMAIITIQDVFSSISVPKMIPTSEVILDFKANGRGIAVGKVSELDETFESAWDISAPRFKLSSGPALIWSGNATSGDDIIIPDRGFNKFNLFIIMTDKWELNLIGVRNGLNLSAFGNVRNSSSQSTYSLLATLENMDHHGNGLVSIAPGDAVRIDHLPSSGHSTGSFSITAIYGVI